MRVILFFGPRVTETGESNASFLMIMI